MNVVDIFVVVWLLVGVMVVAFDFWFNGDKIKKKIGPQMEILNYYGIGPIALFLALLFSVIAWPGTIFMLIKGRKYEN